MSCMKCGRDLEPGQVFCEDCLADMKKYPVKLGTVANLPHRRPESAAKRPPRKKTIPPEEQIRRLRRRNRNLTLWLVALLIALAVLGFFTVRQALDDETYRPGQNYSSMETTGPEDRVKESQSTEP